MKKTLNINLAGSIYHIDEDAYILLDKYLRSLREHFTQGNNGDEIISDIELRISELFTEHLQKGYSIISIEQVEEVIQRIGSPEQMEDEAEKNENPASHSAKEETEKVKRRFFRDPDDKIIGGVLSGLAYYYDWNSTTLRIIVVLFSIFGLFWTTILVYLILWFLIPEAQTTAEKLSMKGEHVTVENIGKSVTEGFEKVNQYIRSPETKSRFQRISEKIIGFIGCFLKVIFIGLCILLVPLLIPLFIVCFGLVIAAIAALKGTLLGIPALFPYFDWSLISQSPPAFIGIGLVLLFLVGLPLILVIHSIMRYFGKAKPLSGGIKLTFLLIWLIAVTVGIILTTHIVAISHMGGLQNFIL